MEMCLPALNAFNELFELQGVCGPSEFDSLDSEIDKNVHLKIDAIAKQRSRERETSWVFSKQQTNG